jgi:SOS response associated peptidase (SRAP)
VPASGYYEWRPAEGGKQPYFISAADGTVLSIAGLWDEWRDPESGETVLSCTLVVAAALEFARQPEQPAVPAMFTTVSVSMSQHSSSPLQGRTVLNRDASG